MVDRIIRIKFIMSAKNKADGFMKNVGGIMYEEHHRDFVATKESMGIH